MAQRRDDNGAPAIERPARLLPSDIAPSHAGAIRVGPNAAARSRLVQTRLGVAGRLPDVSAGAFAVGPHPAGESTGVVGFREIELSIADRDPALLDARVFFPAQPIVQVVDGRIARTGGGINGTPATASGGWPVVVLVHGLAPSYIAAILGRRAQADADALCRGVEIDDDGFIHLVRRWESTQRALARAGYVSLAIDMSWRDEAKVAHPAHVRAGVEAFFADPEWAAVVNPQRLGLVGHSTGSAEVNRYATELGAAAVAVLGPVDIALGDRPNLVIGDEEDTNRRTLEVFRSSARRTNQHMVLLYYYSHYAFFDGICEHLFTEDAVFQRSTSRLALLAFFDKYVRGMEVPEDLGIHVDPPGQQGVRLVCPGGQGCEAAG